MFEGEVHINIISQLRNCNQKIWYNLYIFTALITFWLDYKLNATQMPETTTSLKEFSEL